MVASSLHIDIFSILTVCILICFPFLSILASAVFQFCIFDFAFFISAYWHLHYFSFVYLTCFDLLCVLTSAVFEFYILLSLLVSAYWHLQYFSSVCFTLRSSFVLIDICSISVLYILLRFPRLCILISAVFQLCIFYFAFFVSAYCELEYLSSIYFTLVSSSLHIDICSISVLYILLRFPRVWILMSALFWFCMFYFAFPVSAYWYPQYFSSIFYFACLVFAYWHMQYFSSVYFTFVSSCLYTEIRSVSVLYFTLLASFLHIDRCSISFLYFTLLSSSLNIDIYSISVMYFLLCFLHLCILHLQYFSSVYFTLLSSSLLIGICNHLVVYICLYLPIKRKGFTGRVYVTFEEVKEIFCLVLLDKK